jgi:hypothetical protein
MAYKITATDEAIAAALEAVGLPVYFGEVAENQLGDYNFIYYRPSTITKNSINTYLQTVAVYLVTKLSDVETEMDIIEAMEAIKMPLAGAAQYSRYQLADTTEWINVVGFEFSRGLKRSCT